MLDVTQITREEINFVYVDNKIVLLDKSDWNHIFNIPLESNAFYDSRYIKDNGIKLTIEQVETIISNVVTSLKIPFESTNEYVSLVRNLFKP